MGLLPGAVGSTASTEWMPGYVHVSSSSPSADACVPLAIFPPQNAKYQPGCANLFSCAMRTLFAALTGLPTASSHDMQRVTALRSLVRGALWYQGCSDAGGDGSLAEGFGNRLTALTAYLRLYVDVVTVMAHLATTASQEVSCLQIDQYRKHLAQIQPSLAIVIVAITTTRPWLTHVDVVRRFQLGADQQTPSFVRVVDALGGMLAPDCIHLTAAAAVELGQLLGDEMHALLHGTLAPPPPMARLLPTGAEQLRQEYCNCESRDMACRSLPCEDCRLGCVYYATRARAEEMLNDMYAAAEKNPSQRFSVLNTSLRGVNFVYGEISFFSISLLLQEIIRRSHCARRLRFVDLGCGTGVALAAAALSGQCEEVLGIDLMHSKIETCRHVMTLLEASCSGGDAYSVERPSHEFGAKSCGSEEARRWPSRVDIRHGNFLEEEGFGESEWRSADIVYVCSTCFAEDQMKPLLEKFYSALAEGAHVVLLDKQLPNKFLIDSSHCEDQESRSAVFELICSCQCKTSWGHACAYVYRRCF